MEHSPGKDRRGRSFGSSDEASMDLGAESHSDSGDSNGSECGSPPHSAVDDDSTGSIAEYAFRRFKLFSARSLSLQRPDFIKRAAIASMKVWSFGRMCSSGISEKANLFLQFRRNIHFDKAMLRSEREIVLAKRVESNAELTVRRLLRFGKAGRNRRGVKSG
nr:sterol 3-beta-glucosyltransferase UGT80A2-like isoform X2 [Ipomoea batatas]